MVAINHASTGAIIGLTVAPQIALPLAFLSHFVLDAIPHYGDNDRRIKDKSFAVQLLVDAFLCILLVVILAESGSSRWMAAALCAFLAASPDFMWLPKFLDARKGVTTAQSKNVVVRFHSRVQWFQEPVGAVVEIAWLGASVLILAIIL